MKCATCGQPVYESSGWLWHREDRYEDHTVALAPRPAPDLAVSHRVARTQTEQERAAEPERRTAVPPAVTPGVGTRADSGGSIWTEAELREAFGR